MTKKTKIRVINVINILTSSIVCSKYKLLIKFYTKMNTSDNKNVDNMTVLTNNTINDIGGSDIDDIKTTESIETLTSDETVTPDSNEKNDDEPEWIDLLGSGSIMKKIIKKGTPDTRPKRLQECNIRYECSLDDGTIIENFEDFTLQLGDCEVIYCNTTHLTMANSNEHF